jgi:hypothetical protein
MTLARWMPAFDIRSRHERKVAAAPADVRAKIAAGRVPPGRLGRALMRLRGLSGAERSSQDLVTQMEGLGFVLLETTKEGWVLGAVGRFWRPAPALEQVTPEEFRTWAKPGYAKVAAMVEARPEGSGTRLVTETRVFGLGRRARWLMRAYWTLIGPFSGLIRREMLEQTRRACESSGVGRQVAV